MPGATCGALSALVAGDNVVRVGVVHGCLGRIRAVESGRVGITRCMAQAKIGSTSVNDVEKDFWVALEYRICREFAGFEDRALRSLGCDGLIPEEYNLQVDEPSIRGTARCGPSGQEPWAFTLLIGSGATSPATIDWSSLLPPDDVTGWLSPHLREQRIVIDPHSAYPD